ncbi:HEAT repeat domain-containing protein [Streptomyces abyssomicinicus]|uniref:HEAT repeat domain-containing protein n=1 Tax=Streptomyces abyssomicinicus TaxID=574929 RepID=UPI00124F84A9|nr:HEAT repeat domain-containing protein [Streptomyces abyssomicinicus]
MESRRSVSSAGARLDDLAAGLADQDSDLDALHEVEKALVASWEPQLLPRLEEHLTAAGEARNWYARAVLAGVLAETVGRAALPALVQAYSRDLGDDQDSLTTTLHVLAREDPAAARAFLVPWADHADPGVRRTAIWLLGFVPDSADLPMLTRAAADPDERIRSVVPGTLGSLGTASAGEVLVGLLLDPSEQVRVSALGSLGYAARAETLPHIRALADDQRPRVRAWVAIALGHFPQEERGRPDTSRVLNRLADDPDRYVREQAAKALS